MKNDWKLKAKESLLNFNYMKKSIACIKQQLEGCDTPELEDKLRKVSANVKSMELALSFLSDWQLDILDEFFISGREGHVDRLCKKLMCEKSTVYRLKNDALKAFYMYMFGSMD